MKNEAFALVAARLQSREAIDEHAVARFIEAQFAARDLATIHSPTVGVGPNSATIGVVVVPAM